MREVVFSRQIVNQILTHAMHHSSVEVCGLVSAKDGVPFEAYPIRNCACNSSVRFEMEPKQLIDTVRSFRESDETLFAIYHSHPTSAAIPSETDVAEAEYPEAILHSSCPLPRMCRIWHSKKSNTDRQLKWDDSLSYCPPFFMLLLTQSLWQGQKRNHPER